MSPYPTVHISFYEGGRDVSYEYPEDLCKFALCEEMPPEPGAKCCWNKHACTLAEARVSALEAVRRWCGGEAKREREEAASCE